MTPRIKMKQVFIFASVSIALLVAGWLVFTYLNVGITSDSKAAGSTYISIQTGNWTAGSTWNIGSAPPATLNGDNITVSSNHTVTLTGNLNALNNVTITIQNNAVLRVNGDLIVQNNLALVVDGDFIVTGSITINNGASIAISGGGEMTTGGNLTLNNNATVDVDGVLNIGGSFSMGNNGSFGGSGEVNIIGSGCNQWQGPGSCDDNITLPIELISFSATTETKGKVVVTWQTASEQNNNFFTIERSSDGLHYDSIGFTQGSGTTSIITKYSYNDNYPPAGVVYYRLKQTDYDGTSKTFNPVAVTVAQREHRSIAVYPNPLRSSTLNVNVPDPDEGVIEVLSAEGNLVLSRAVHESGNVTLEFNPELQNGVYYVKYRSAASTETVKVIKQ